MPDFREHILMGISHVAGSGEDIVDLHLFRSRILSLAFLRITES
jgi:hypothetical protein